MINLAKIFSVRNVATFVFILFSIRYIPLETRGGPSMIKLAVSAIAPLLIMTRSFKFNRSSLLLSLYFISTLISALLLSLYFISTLIPALFHPESFRISTILYLLSFLVVFQMYYNFVYHENAFTFEYYLNLIKRLIVFFTVVLMIQQLFLIAGITVFKPINLTYVLGVGIGANSMMAEPSTFARIIIALFLSLIRMYEIKLGEDKITIRTLYKNAKWPVLAFMWSILSMISGTAMVGLAILMLYFVKRKYIMIAIPTLALLFFVVAPNINFVPVQRAYKTLNAALTLDIEEVIKADHSAAGRVVPMINTINNLDITKASTWFGHGTDANLSGVYLDDSAMVGSIKDYGLLSYILLLTFIFTCCIRFWSLETLVFCVLMSANLGNVAYGWGIMIIFTTTRYFITQSKTRNNSNDESNTHYTREG